MRYAFAALALCYHSLYAEKTTDGWHASQRPGQQWRAEAFVEAYLERPGRQVPYDALVVLQPLLGLGTTDQAKALTADKVQLVLWAELAA